MASNSLKVGIIGCGNIAPKYMQGCGVFHEIIEVVACADLDITRAQQFAAQHNLTPYSVPDLLANPSIDIIINLTIPKAHAEVSLAVIAAGKHVYSEKPLAITFEDGQQIMQAAQQANVRVGCAPDTFLGAGGQTSRHVIDQGIIGQPVGAMACFASPGPDAWHPNPFFYYEAGGGPLLDMGPYYITTLVNLLGPVSQVTALAKMGTRERFAGHEAIRGQKIPVSVSTHYTGLLEFQNGATASVIMSFETWGHHLPPIEVYGTDGALSVPDPNTFGGVVRVKTASENWSEVPPTHRSDVQRGLGVADMAQAIQSNHPHRASGDLALHVLEIMTAFDRAAQSGSYIRIETCPTMPEALPVNL